MTPRPMPKWMQRAKDLQARAKSPAGVPFAAKKTDKVAKLYLYDAIGHDPWTDTGIDPTDVVAALAEARGADSLEVYINSPGGFVFDGVAIFNTIRSFAGPKTVYVDGVAASIASIIAMAGDRVVMNEGSMFMVHDPMGGVMSFGTADDIEGDCTKTCNALRAVRTNLLDIYGTATGQTPARISEWMTAETWMTAAEAVANGFADEVASVPVAEAARAATTAKPYAASPRVTADLARAQNRALSERFAAASRGVPPGQPGNHKPQPHTGRKNP